MPIYEFKCLKCEEFFELLVMGSGEQNTMQCPKCKSENFERILSTTNYSMPGGGNSTGAAKGVNAETRTCSSGSCTTYNIPGPK